MQCYNMCVILFILMSEILLKLVTWNATGVISSAPYLQKLLYEKDTTICGRSEHWLYENNVHFLDSVFSNYKPFTVCGKDLSLPSKRRVGKGGVTLLWGKDIDDHVSPLMCDDDRIIDIHYQVSPSNYVFIFQ